MFYFRINKLKIYDNQESPSFLGIIGPDEASVKLLSFIATDEMPIPDMDDFIKSKSATERKEISKVILESVVSSRIFTTIEKVKDNHVMTFGDAGYNLYSSKLIPENFSWQLIAIESDSSKRTLGQKIDDIVTNEKIDDFSNNLYTLVKGVSNINPGFVAAVAAGKYIAQTISEFLKNDEDDLIGVLYMSLNRTEHYPHLIRNIVNVRDLTNNMLIDYTIFGIEK